jgi:hypothetical protein
MNSLVTKMNVFFALIFLWLPLNSFGQDQVRCRLGWWCLPQSTKEELAESKAVFIGTILSVSKYDFSKKLMQRDDSDATYKVVARVDEFWKGIRTKQIAFLIYLGNSESRFTLESIKEVERFLVYAKEWKSLNELFVPVACTRTTKLASANGDLLQLGKSKKVK